MARQSWNQQNVLTILGPVKGSPDHSRGEFGPDLYRAPILISAWSDIKNGEDACDRDPELGLCHETSRADSATIAEGSGQGIVGRKLLAIWFTDEALWVETQWLWEDCRVVENRPRIKTSFRDPRIN